MTITGRQWRRPPRTCPDWCARDHQCTAQAGYPAGEHRSDPLRWRTRYGILVATRIERLGGVGHLEVRTGVRLPPDLELARRQAQQLTVRIDLAIRDVLGLPITTQTATNRLAIEETTHHHP